MPPNLTDFKAFFLIEGVNFLDFLAPLPLTHLHLPTIGYGTPHLIIDGRLPDSLIRLHLGPNHNLPITSFPPSLTYFNCGACYNHTVDSLPDTLLILILGPRFNQVCLLPPLISSSPLLFSLLLFSLFIYLSFRVLIIFHHCSSTSALEMISTNQSITFPSHLVNYILVCLQLFFSSFRFFFLLIYISFSPSLKS